MDRKGLATAIAALLVLGASGSASALTRARDGRTGTNPVPEPSSALVFGLGLLAASRISRLVR